LPARQNILRGQAARLIFDIVTESEEGHTLVQGERMNVIVTERQEDRDGVMYLGILDDAPVLVGEGAYLQFGAEVPFRPEHVIDILDPPAEYVEWQLGQPPEACWPRE
jgi:hypothetical protein